MSWLPVGAAVLGTVGCAASGPFPSTSGPGDAGSIITPADPAPTASGPTQSGQDAAADLSGFSCRPNPDGADLWTATGTLTNPTDTQANYRITVLVTGSGSSRAATQRTVDLDPGKSADVEMGRVRGPVDGTCQVQVLRTP